MKKMVFFTTVITVLIFLFFVAAMTGPLTATPIQILRGLFIEFDPVVAAIYNMRFPRIFVALLAGAGISTAGLLLQSLLKNPLADPGMLGISSTATLSSMLWFIFFPRLIQLLPIAALIGALMGFALIYGLAYQENANPTRLILVGIALNALMMGLLDVINGMMGGNLPDGGGINMSFQTWRHVHLLLVYVSIGIGLTVLAIPTLDLMRLSDQTVTSIGVSVNKRRFYLAFIAALLIGIASGVVGPIGFLGLIVPHMAKLMVGQQHKTLIPATVLLGALTLLLADTVGRTVMAPLEISPSIVMSMMGGPLLIYLIRRNKRHV
ncbi:MAG: iron ABC transporter permease [Defluviitaleaceae bacterium]|nr:iron ABC transporter permease [Defluviitaleaceae bacterium]